MSKDPLWIEHAHMRHGALHRALGVSPGTKIGPAKITKAESSSSPTVSREARLAKTLIGLKKK